jgi:hypothetical protein
MGGLLKSVLLLMILASLCVGCATPLTPEQQSQLNIAMTSPLDFNADKSESSDVWGRAQSFIGRFSSMKLQIATDYVIQTYNPDPNGLDAFGYYITKTPVGESDEFNVKCVTNDAIFSGGRADQNAHILAYYMKTGTLLDFAISR